MDALSGGRRLTPDDGGLADTVARIQRYSLLELSKIARQYERVDAILSPMLRREYQQRTGDEPI